MLSALPVFSDCRGVAVKLVYCTALCSWNLSLLVDRYKDVLLLPLSSHAAVPLKGKRLRIIGNYPVRLICACTNFFFVSENLGTGPHDTRGFARWSSGTCAGVCNLEMLNKEVISLSWLHILLNTKSQGYRAMEPYVLVRICLYTQIIWCTTSNLYRVCEIITESRQAVTRQMVMQMVKPAPQGEYQASLFCHIWRSMWCEEEPNLWHSTVSFSWHLQIVHAPV